MTATDEELKAINEEMHRQFKMRMREKPLFVNIKGRLYEASRDPFEPADPIEHVEATFNHIDPKEVLRTAFSNTEDE